MWSSLRLWGFLSIFGLVLWFSLIEGSFTRDEDHYLTSIMSLRHGDIHVSIPQKIPLSIELASFNPGLVYHENQHYKRERALLIPRVPPLYAVLAYPFAALGWDYLFLINILSYLLAAWLVFLYTRRYSAQPHSPWLACLIFLFGSYTFEYAPAVWPHMLSLSLCLASMYASSRVRDNETLWWACFAGLFVGMATGIRYQNIVWCAAIGLGIFLSSPRRFKASLAYIAGLFGPLFFNAWVNFLRFQSWNPITKGKGYLSSPKGSHMEFFHTAWAKIFDYSAHPTALFEKLTYISFQPKSGAYVMLLAVRKAFVQSIPWVLIALFLLLWVWGHQRSRLSSSQQRELRAQSLPVFFLLGAFSVMGLGRHAGFCHNQRYFLELIPLVAIALVWAMESISFRWKALWGGVLGGIVFALSLFLLGRFHPLRLWLVLKVPLVMGAFTLGVWWLARTRPPWAGWAWGLVGLCLGWSCAIHFSEDVHSMRYLRSINQQHSLILQRILPPKTPSVFFAYGGANTSAIPLRLSHKIMLVDPWLDQGADAIKIAKASLQEKHRVFMLVSGMLPKIVKMMLRAFSYKVVHRHRWFTVVELKERVTHRKKSHGP